MNAIDVMMVSILIYFKFITTLICIKNANK